MTVGFRPGESIAMQATPAEVEVTAAHEEYRDRPSTAPAGYCGQGDASSARRKPSRRGIKLDVAKADARRESEQTCEVVLTPKARSASQRTPGVLT